MIGLQYGTNKGASQVQCNHSNAHIVHNFWGDNFNVFGRGLTLISLFQAGMTPYGASRQIRPEGLSLHCLVTSFHKLFQLNLPMKTKLQTTSIIVSLTAELHSGLREGCFERQDDSAHVHIYIIHYTLYIICCICWWSFQLIYCQVPSGSQPASLSPACYPNCLSPPLSYQATLLQNHHKTELLQDNVFSEAAAVE